MTDPGHSRLADRRQKDKVREYLGARRWQDAVAAAAALCRTAPDDPEAWLLLGHAHRQLGQLEVAEQCARAALARQSASVDALFFLGDCLQARGSPVEALDLFQRCVALAPQRADAWFRAGFLEGLLGRFDAAIAAYRQALTVRPGWAEVHNNLGNALYARGLQEDALASLATAVRLAPNMANAHNNLGIVLAAQDRAPEAIESFRVALRLQPEYPTALNNLGNALFTVGELSEAMTHLETAVRLRPDYADAHANLGGVYYAQGRVREAMTKYEDALRLNPGLHAVHSNLLYCMNCIDMDPGTVAAAHLDWARRHANVPRRETPHVRVLDPERRLRIGYVSPDLRAHSVSYFLSPLLAHHDPAAVEVFCYSDVVHPDDRTAHLQSLVPSWRHVRGLSDEAVTARIETDAIDILVDLAGHTSGHRLRLFARKPAPICFTYLGYPNTTGLAQMDYRLTDAWADPPGVTDGWYSERLMRMPEGFLCYAPPAEAPDVAPSPARTTGAVTFGSFNALPKITPDVVAVWARTLRGIPGSRLLLKHRFLQDGATRERYLRMFSDQGIGPDRILLHGHAPDLRDHLAQYGRVDIALDSFPYNGTTTTCEALWMGVPVVTLAGRVHAARVGVSILSRIGLPELIARDGDDYVAIAAGLARDSDRLAELRRTLRERMRASPLLDGPGFARAVERAYRERWRLWCAAGCEAPGNRG